MIYGIDVSHHNEWIDWPKVKAAGVRFAFIKASEGDGYIDPLYEENIHGALQAVSCPARTTSFCRAIDPLEQARHYVRDAAGKRRGRPHPAALH